MIIRVVVLVLFVVALSTSHHIQAAGLSSDRSADGALWDIHSARDDTVSAHEEKPLLKRFLSFGSHSDDRMEASTVEDTSEAEERWRQEILEAQRLRMQSQLERSRGYY